MSSKPRSKWRVRRKTTPQSPSHRKNEFQRGGRILGIRNRERILIASDATSRALNQELDKLQMLRGFLNPCDILNTYDPLSNVLYTSLPSFDGYFLAIERMSPLVRHGNRGVVRSAL